jgi:hypothetical protein
MRRWRSSSPSVVRGRTRKQRGFYRPILEELESWILPSTYTVTSTADSGAGSLRDAIGQANANPGSTIDFNIAPGGVQNIAIQSELDVTSPMTIDGTTEPGYSGSPLIVLDGSTAASKINGMYIVAGKSTVLGLDIVGCGGDGMILGVNGGNTIQGNYLGVDPAGTVARGNGNVGLLVFNGSSNNTIGGTASGAGNVIAFNHGSGIDLADAATTGNTIRGNSIHDNAGLGIDLGGVVLNHTGDSLSGPNNLLNYPIIETADPGAATKITGKLNSGASATYTIDFYANARPNVTLYGDGQRYLGSTTVTTDATGNATFSVTPAFATNVGEWITATATDAAGDTSEFSAAHELPARPIALSETAWTPIGPAPIAANYNAPIVAGRIQMAAAVPGDPNVMYVGTDNGGIWKTSDWLDAAPAWTPLTDAQPSLSIGDKGLVVAPSNSQIVYASATSPDGGVLKSIDGGKTWSYLGAQLFQNAWLGAVVTSPTDASTVYLAERDSGSGGGLWKSTDGGQTWSNITSKYHLGGVSDVVIDPKNASVLYAGFVNPAGVGSNGV